MFAKYKDVVYQCLMVAVGCAIFGAGIDSFVLPHKLVSTGISGVGLILYSYILGCLEVAWYACRSKNAIRHTHVILDDRSFLFLAV